MEHVLVLGLILALALGLVSLALLARLPQREAPAGVTWLPITLLLYNLWVAGFLATIYARDRLVPQAPTVLPPVVVVSRLALLALALAWLYAHVAQLQAFVGTPPTRAARVARITLTGLGVVLVAGLLLASRTGNPVFFLYPVSAVAATVFPAALVASVFFYVRSRRVEDTAWRMRLSRLALAYIGLFTCLFVLSIGWSRLAAVSPGLPVAIDLILELLYNIVAIIWVLRLTTWLGRTPEVQLAPGAVLVPDPARLFAEHGITRREAEIIHLICLGRTNQEIANQLFISLTTVKDHNYVAFQKLGVRNRTELTRLVLGAPQVQPKSAS